jgi:hypothetical protein
MKRRRPIVEIALLLALSSLLTRQVTGARSAHTTPASPLTVHEWGTFTSIAGPDGRAMSWPPLNAPQDLGTQAEKFLSTAASAPSSRGGGVSRRGDGRVAAGPRARGCRGSGRRGIVRAVPRGPRGGRR